MRYCNVVRPSKVGMGSRKVFLGFYDFPHAKDNVDFGEAFFEIFFRFALSFAASIISCCALYSVKKLQRVLTTHLTVQPNCGEQGCLRRNAGGSDGWTIKRPKKPRFRKKNRSQNPSPSRNRSQTLGTNPDQASEGDLRKADLQGRGKNVMRPTALQPSKALFYSLQ